MLAYSTTNRDGYKEYKSNPEKCKDCPHLWQCTQSKAQQKVVTRHVWEEYLELAEDYRHTPLYRDIYKMRSQTIERVFADAKEKHAMRYTQLRGLQKVTMQVTLTFACMNLKKLATWKRRKGLLAPLLHFFGRKISTLLPLWQPSSKKDTLRFAQDVFFVYSLRAFSHID